MLEELFQKKLIVNFNINIKANTISSIKNNELEIFLRYGVEILENLNIPYWLDCGTLLGIVRENHLLSWETDIDIGVLQKNLKDTDVLNIVKKATMDGFQVNVYKSFISICKNDLVFDIKIYTQHNNYVVEEKLQPKNLISSAIGFLLHSFSSEFYLDRKGRNLFNKIIINLIKILTKIIPFKIRLLISRPFYYLYKNFLTIDISEAIPEVFIEEFVELNFLEKLYLVPKDKEEYLAFRYGNNWTEPNQNWITEKDDGSYKLWQDVINSN